jgi:hypothetical protein
MHPNTAAALAEGRKRALARRRELKTAGQVERVWGGARPLPHHSRDPKIRKAQRMVEKAMERLPAAIGISRMSKAEKLSRAAELALDCVTQILELGIDPTDAKTFAAVKDTALNVIAQAIRVDALKELHARGEAAADGGHPDELRLFDLAFAELHPHQSALAAPLTAEKTGGDDGGD